jgi:putative glutamine amidotransferase
MKNKPLVGIVLDWQNAGGYSAKPWYALRDNYASAVAKNGGVPILLPYIMQDISYYTRLLDGLVIPGGDYDIDPSEYGEAKKDANLITNNFRYNFEKNLLESFLATSKPVLGICAGMQLMNVVMGGSLLQDILSEVPKAIDHEQRNLGQNNGDPYHDINIVEGSLLSKIYQLPIAKVNSSHHQGVNQLGKNLKISAYAEDGIVEAIEIINHRFALGVQWHPEYLTTPIDQEIISSLIKFI